MVYKAFWCTWPFTFWWLFLACSFYLTINLSYKSDNYTVRSFSNIFTQFKSVIFLYGTKNMIHLEVLFVSSIIYFDFFLQYTHKPLSLFDSSIYETLYVASLLYKITITFDLIIALNNYNYLFIQIKI